MEGKIGKGLYLYILHDLMLNLFFDFKRSREFSIGGWLNSVEN